MLYQLSDPHPLGQVCTASGQVRTGSGRPSLPPSPHIRIVCGIYNSTDTTYYNVVAAATVGQSIVLKLSLSPPGGGTMPSSATSATKIAVSTRWNQPYVPFSGQYHVTVSSRARIEARIVQGTITVTAMPVPATRNCVRHLPLADALGVSDEGPSDGPPRRRQRTLESFLASSPASSTSSTRLETMTERRVTGRYHVDENGDTASSATYHVDETEVD